MKNKLFFKKSTFMLFWSFALMLILFYGKGYGQVNISAGNTITQNFDGIGSTATATLPIGWKMENVTAARNVATAYASVANTATTSATTYKVQILTNSPGTTVYINKRSDTYVSAISTITAMEIAA